MLDLQDLTIIGAVLLVAEILGILLAIHAVMQPRSSQGATAWAIALISAPVAILPFYLVLGRNRFRGYVDARRDSDSEHQWVATKARNVA